MDLAKKRKKEQKDLSIIQDVKEPFSWNRFWDEKVLAGYKTFKKHLEERGILHVLMSPFQYRTRLVIKLIIISIAIIIGIVPRTIRLVNEAKERNAASEIAAIMKKSYVSNTITINALASSQAGKKHVIVFKITGDTKNGVPSTKDGFDVLLSPQRGNSDVEHVKYSYTIVPMDLNTRLLVLYVDNTEQKDHTGIFGVRVNVKDTPKMKEPIEVVLSDNQETNKLYDGEKIDLTTLADKLGLTSEQPTQISTAKEALDKAINVYKINEERLAASNIKLSLTTDKLKEFIEENKYKDNIEDNSLTSDTTIPPEAAAPVVIKPPISLIVDGKEYTEKDHQNTKNKLNDISATEMQTVLAQLSDVITKLNGLNTYRYAKYNELYALSRILNKEYIPTEFGDMVNVDPTIPAY